jgi:glycosyltransferase involved in cell wall biosynthesis
MRVLIASDHRYPASVGGPAGCRVLDFLAKGLAELGHTVFYYLEKDPPSLPLPAGVTYITAPRWDVDIVHPRDYHVLERLGPLPVPYLRTCHTDVAIYAMDRSINTEHCIYVSQNLARSYGRERFVLNGVDPTELMFSSRKRNYMLFVCGLDRAIKKGIEQSVEIAREAGLPLVVAGSSQKPEVVEFFGHFFRENDVRHVGEVYGTEKAKLFAYANAFLFPTSWNEGFGMVMAEALMSGTPVICSSLGACPEVVNSKVGFVCSSHAEYMYAARHVGDISPLDCRKWALKTFHHRVMAQGYVREYEAVLASR